MRPLLLVVLLLVALYLLLMIAAWAWQERLVWQPPAFTPSAESRARRIDYVAEDAQPLYAYLAGEPRTAPGLLIAFHGNAEPAAWNVAWANEVARRTGWAVLVPEYRGYGGLGGAPTYVGSRRDARAAYRLAREQLGVDSARIALYGHSLGTAIAAELAAEHRPAALALVAPFTSAREMARGIGGLPIWALWGLIGRVNFDTRARLATVDAPVSVAQGDRDAVIPVRMGRAVYASARVKGELLIVSGAGHNDVIEVAGEEYWRWLAGALERAGQTNDPKQTGSR